MIPITARTLGDDYAPGCSSEMATAVPQAIAARLHEVSVAGWSSITSSSVVTEVQITFQTCARCARPVTTAGTAAGGGGLKIHDFWGATGWG
jgi:hypothetical protein